MLIKDIQPHISLAEFVRKYQIIWWKYDVNVTPPNKFLAPRPEYSLAFYIRDLQAYSFIGSTKKETYPKSIVSGIHTKTLIRDCGHDFWALKIIFHPSALYRLTGLPMHELVSDFANSACIAKNEGGVEWIFGSWAGRGFPIYYGIFERLGVTYFCWISACF